MILLTLYTAQDIAEAVPSVVAAGLSVNRVMAMLTQLVNDGSLIRTEDKQKTYFSLASQNEKQQRPQPSAPAAAVRQPTPKQVSYTGFKADILAWMKPDTLYTAQDIAKGVPSVVAAGFSVDRVMPYLTQLSDDGALEKTDDGAKRYYSLPGTEAKRSAREKAEREEKEREAAAALRTVLAHRQEEERRKAEEARRQEEERRKAEEARRQEEERRKAEEARRQEEERRRAEEEARKAEEAHRRAEEEARKAEEARRLAEESHKAEKEASARQESAKTAYSGTDAHTEKGKSGVSKYALISVTLDAEETAAGKLLMVDSVSKLAEYLMAQVYDDYSNEFMWDEEDEPDMEDFKQQIAARKAAFVEEVTKHNAS